MYKTEIGLFTNPAYLTTYRRSRKAFFMKDQKKIKYTWQKEKPVLILEGRDGVTRTLKADYTRMSIKDEAVKDWIEDGVLKGKTSIRLSFFDRENK